MEFEITSKRRKGFPSETHVKHGYREIHGKEFIEKLGRKDPCPCGSSKRFARCCMSNGTYDGSKRNYYVR